AVLHLAEAHDDRVEIVAAGLELGAQRGELLGELGNLAGSGARLCEDRAPAQLADILAEVADRQLAWLLDVAVVGSFLTYDQAKDGALAGAVGPDESDFLSGVDLKGGVDKQDLPAVLLGHRGERD